MSLSRRDRAAMTLALEWAAHASLGRFRARHADADARWFVDMADDALDLGGEVGDDLRAALYGRSGGRIRVPPRVLRARLALALRAMLRADRGDYGRLVCACFGEERDAETGDGRYCRFKRPRRYTALWSQAPATGTTTRPAGLRRRDESAGTPSRAGGV